MTAKPNYWSRRRLLIAVSGALVGILGVPRMSRPEVGLVLRESRATRALGRHYLASRVEAEPRVRALRRRLRGCARAERLEFVQVRRDRDLAAGRVHVVDGWVLAEIEAQICALSLIA